MIRPTSTRAGARANPSTRRDDGEEEEEGTCARTLKGVVYIAIAGRIRTIDSRGPGPGPRRADHRLRPSVSHSLGHVVESEDHARGDDVPHGSRGEDVDEGHSHWIAAQHVCTSVLEVQTLPEARLLVRARGPAVPHRKEHDEGGGANRLDGEERRGEGSGRDETRGSEGGGQHGSNPGRGGRWFVELRRGRPRVDSRGRTRAATLTTFSRDPMKPPLFKCSDNQSHLMILFAAILPRGAQLCRRGRREGGGEGRGEVSARDSERVSRARERVADLAEVVKGGRGVAAPDLTGPATPPLSLARSLSLTRARPRLTFLALATTGLLATALLLPSCFLMLPTFMLMATLILLSLLLLLLFFRSVSLSLFLPMRVHQSLSCRFSILTPERGPSLLGVKKRKGPHNNGSGARAGA